MLGRSGKGKVKVKGGVKGRGKKKDVLTSRRKKKELNGKVDCG